jgi:hypothetical protein
MTRLTPALAVWISLVAAASASLTPRKDRPPLGPEAPQVLANKLSAPAPQQAGGVGSAPEFAVTERTEILLDGKPCRYEDVPEKARILRMEVAPDKKTVLRIQFRSGK